MRLIFKLNFIISKYRYSVSDENQASKFQCAVSIKYTLDFEGNTKIRIQTILLIFRLNFEITFLISWV